MRWPKILGVSTFPVFPLSRFFDSQNWTKRKQGFWTSKTFAKLTENCPRNKVQNHCLKKDQNFVISENSGLFSKLPKSTGLQNSYLNALPYNKNSASIFVVLNIFTIWNRNRLISRFLSLSKTNVGNCKTRNQRQNENVNLLVTF